MILLKLIFKNNRYDFINKIDLMNVYFKKRDINIGIKESLENDTHFIDVVCSDYEDCDMVKKEVLRYISKLVLEIFIEEYYREEISNIVENTYFFLKYEEMTVISKRFYNVFTNDTLIGEEDLIYSVNKRNEILEGIFSCINEGEHFNIDGFFQFRSKEIRRGFEDILNKIVERYMVEKEYDEFIKLLKYFVDVQDSKIDIVNLIVKEDDSCLILNEEGEDIINDIMQDLTTSKYSGQIGFDDLILSGLISYCPKHIVIYSNNNLNNNEMIDTIKSVFEEKVEFKNYSALEDILHPAKV